MKRISGIFAAAILLLLASCAKGPAPFVSDSGLNSKKFVSGKNETRTNLYRLKNEAGMEVCITNYGGRIVSVMVPGKDSVMRDVVLGFDNIKDYQTIPSDFGATIGRYANRIAGGKFTLGETEYTLPTNNNGNTLHGGPEGWQYKVFNVNNATPETLTLSYISEDGEMGFPGQVDFTVIFNLTEDNALYVKYIAWAHGKTVVNFTNHAYFNLSGDPTRTIEDHVLYLNALQTTPVNAELTPDGSFAPVSGTPFDFTAPKAIGQDIEAENEQLAFGMGYDHNWVLATEGKLSKVAATLCCPETGISLEIRTTEPGIQVYTGNVLDGTVTGKNAVAYPRRSAVCLETQHFPDSPNKSAFPSTVLAPGKKYESLTIYKFGVEK